MVATVPHCRPTRMFACLSFTGEDRKASPLTCDLARVASIVPAMALPTHLCPRNKNDSPTPNANEAKFVDNTMRNALGNEKIEDVLPSDHELTAMQAPSDMMRAPSCDPPSNQSVAIKPQTPKASTTVGTRKRPLEETEEIRCKVGKMSSSEDEDELFNITLSKKTMKTSSKRPAAFAKLKENERRTIENDRLISRLLTVQDILKSEEDCDRAYSNLQAFFNNEQQQHASNAANN